MSEIFLYCRKTRYKYFLKIQKEFSKEGIDVYEDKLGYNVIFEKDGFRYPMAQEMFYRYTGQCIYVSNKKIKNARSEAESYNILPLENVIFYNMWMARIRGYFLSKLSI